MAALPAQYLRADPIIPGATIGSRFERVPVEGRVRRHAGVGPHLGVGRGGLFGTVRFGTGCFVTAGVWVFCGTVVFGGAVIRGG